MANTDIDIVILWVDGSDEVWQDQFRQYADTGGDSREIRFRDWGLLPYWFRGIEQFMPWVNKIHFVTAGHFPKWLNLAHPRLKLVKHEDFIPSEYLPTFNANTIELNLHRIKGLSDRFVYFNDDTFVLNPLPEKRFFQDGLPCDFGVMTAKPSSGGIIHIAINDLEILGQHFDKHKQMRDNFSKWFSLCYGRGLLNNLLLLPWRDFSGFVDPHLPNAFLKSTFLKVWDTAFDTLDATCRRKFRSNGDVNQWLVRYWQLAEGCFKPFNTLKGSINQDINEANKQAIQKEISQRLYNIMCLNDSEDIVDFDEMKTLLQSSFTKIFPGKSTFEI